MVSLRMTGLLFLCFFIIVGPLLATELHLERLAAYGHGGYQWWAGTVAAPVAVTHHTLEFIDLSAAGGPRRRATVYLGDAPLIAAAADREYLWVQDDQRLRLLRLGVNNARTLIYFDSGNSLVAGESGASVASGARVDAWAGDRARLAVLSQHHVTLYRVDGETGLVRDHEFDVTLPVSGLTLAGDRLVLQTPDALLATSVYATETRQFETLAVPEDVRFDPAGIAADGDDVVALDQRGRNLLQWRWAGDRFQAEAAVPLAQSDGRLAIRYVDDQQRVVADEGARLWLFARDGDQWLLDRRYSNLPHHDVWPLDAQNLLTADARGLQLRRREGARLTVRARLEEGGIGGDIAVKDDIVYWVQGDALHVFDCSNPYQPQLVHRVQLGPIRRLQLADNVLAILANDLFLFDIINPRSPQPGPTLYNYFQDMALADGRLVTLGTDNRGRPELVMHAFDDDGTPQALARVLVDGDPQHVAIEDFAVFTLDDFRLTRFAWRPLERSLVEREVVAVPGGNLAPQHLAVRDGRVFVLAGNGDVIAFEDEPLLGLRATVALPVAGAAYGLPSRLSTDAQRLVVGGRDLVLVDRTKPHELTERAHLAGAGVAATASRDGLIFVSGGSSGRLEIVRVAAGVAPLYVPWVSNSDAFRGEVRIVNAGAEAQRLQVRAFAQDGIPRGRTLEMPAQTVREWRADQLFPGLTGYSLEIAAPHTAVQVFYRRFDPTGSVVVPAVNGAALGSDLVFPCAEFGDLHRVLVVTALAEGVTDVLARVQTLDKQDGSIVAEFSHPLKVGRAGIIRLPGFADDSARIQVAQGVRLVGEQFRFDIAQRQTSVSGWSPSSDADDQAGLDLLDTWTNPNPNHAWRALQAVGERVAAADHASITMLRYADRKIVAEHRLDGFHDIRDVAWRHNLMAVADADGVHLLDVTADGTLARRQSLPVQAHQVAVAVRPRPVLVIGEADTWALYDLSAGDLSRPAAQGTQQPNSRFWLADGWLTVFEDFGDVVVRDVRRPQNVGQAHVVQHGLLFEDGLHQIVRQGGRLLWLHPRFGLLGLYQPWFPTRAPWAQARLPLFQAATPALSSDGVVVADRHNGLKLIETANPFAFQIVAHRRELKPDRVAVAGERIWASDMQTGNLSVLVRADRLPQTHFPYVPLNQADLYLDIHQSGAVADSLRWRAGTASIPSASGDLTIKHRENPFNPDMFGAGANGWTSVSFRGARPVQAWLSGSALGGRWARGLRDEELATEVMLPVHADLCRAVTVMDRGNGGEMSLTLTVLADGDALARHVLTLAGGATVTHALDQLFGSDVLAVAEALHISGPGEARLGAVVHLYENDRLKQLVTGTPVR